MAVSRGTSWGDEGYRRDDPAARWNQERAARGAKKNTRVWCRGKVGLRHEPIIALSHAGERAIAAGREPCRPPDQWMWQVWWCSHEKRCAKCGKILNPFIELECPNIPEEIRPKLMYERESAEHRLRTKAAWVPWDELPVEAQDLWREKAADLIDRSPR